MRHMLLRRGAPPAGRDGARKLRPAALVLGSDEIASAIAIAVHRAGLSIVLLDEIDPCWPRRGMSFTDAWYLGSARVDGTEAVFCGSARSIPAIVERDEAIVASTWSWRGLLGVLHPVAVIDARAARVPREALCGQVPGEVLAVGVGPDVVVGEHADLAVETAAGDRLGEILHEGATRAAGSLPPMLGGAAGERFVHAREAGRFFTRQRIGDAVARNDWIGVLGTSPVRAPIGGVLRGLSARGARVPAGAPLVEIDPRGDPALCFGIEPLARVVAAGVLRALAPVTGPTEHRRG